MRSRLWIVVGCALVLWSSGGSSARSAQASEGSRVLVTFASDATAAERDAAVGAVGGAALSTIPHIGVTRVVVHGEPRAAASTIARMPGVRAAEPDAAVHLSLVPNDPLYLRDPYSGLGQWGLRIAGVDRAWDLSMGSPDVVVATIDTGVDPNHPDLAGALLPPVTTLTSVSAGCGFAAIDDNSHGTHVAGIIAAIANNGIGIAGVASGVRLLSIKALDCVGSGAVSDLASALIYAADHGARIVNISVGSPNDSFALRDAVRYAQGKGLLIVAAAGNCGAGAMSCASVNQVEYPAAYPGVIAVGATANDDTLASFSTQGSYVGVSAPGVRIVSTTPTYRTYLSSRGETQGYGILSGTSQAAPFVAGVAALALSQDHTLTAQQLADRLRATADDLGPPGPDPLFGSGRVNALRALSSPGGVYGAVYEISTTARTAAAGATFALFVKLTNTSDFAWSANAAIRLSYHWVDAAGTTVVWDGRRAALPAVIPINGSLDLLTQVMAPPAAGLYTLRFDMVNDGVTWFSSAGVRTGDISILVAGPFSATYAPAATTSSLAIGTQRSLTVTVTNTGSVVWPSSGSQPVRLSYHWLAPDGHVLIWDGARAALPADVAPAASATLALPVTAPPYGGGYVLRLDLVQEGVNWFSAQGVPPKDISFVISSGA